MSERQTVFFTSVDPLNKEHRDPKKIDLEAPRLAWYHQKKWKNHLNTVYSQKDFLQDVGHSSDPDQKQSVIPPTMKDLEENGIESLN